MENWHIAPDVWLRQDMHIRNGIFKQMAMEADAETANFVPVGAQLVDDAPHTAPPPGLLGMFTPRAEPIEHSE